MLISLHRDEMSAAFTTKGVAYFQKLLVKPLPLD